MSQDLTPREFGKVGSELPVRGLRSHREEAECPNRINMRNIFKMAKGELERILCSI